MKLVRQKHVRGCAIASLAMILDVDYDFLAKHFSSRPDNKLARNFDTLGLYQTEYRRYLYDRGYALLIKFLWEDGEKSTPWPPEPFAPQHICSVKVYEDSPIEHIVVMDEKGIVLDPLSDEPRKLTNYFSVSNVMGLYKVVESKAIYRVDSKNATDVLWSLVLPTGDRDEAWSKYNNLCRKEGTDVRLIEVKNNKWSILALTLWRREDNCYEPHYKWSSN